MSPDSRVLSVDMSEDRHAKKRPIPEIWIDGDELEVTQIGKKCHGDGRVIQQEVGKCVMPD